MITCSDAHISLEELPSGKRRILVRPLSSNTYIHRSVWVTKYNQELIQSILEVKGAAYLCDEIMREEDQFYLRPHLELTITSYTDPASLSGKRILDFGCGCGASTIILSQLLPHSQIIGVELDRRFLDVAKMRAEYAGCFNVSFLPSPRGDSIPENTGDFDAIVLSAVYEHLLPEERRRLLPQLWAQLDADGILFIDETPNRWFPIETHTTGLPFINYLPERLAFAYARCCSRRIEKDDTWSSLLRKGIRGASVKEILTLIRFKDSQPVFMEPCRSGINDRVDLWHRGYAFNPIGRYASIKQRSLGIIRCLSWIFDKPIIPYLSLAIKKMPINTLSLIE